VPNYLGDLREVIRRGSGSGLKKDILLRKIGRLELDLSRGGVDVNDWPQRRLCEALAEDQSSAGGWMFKLCVARLVRGDYSDWTGWEYRNEFATGSYSREVPNMRWRLEPVRSISVLGEQGIGDEIMFAGCLPDLLRRVPEVEYECDPRLVPVINRSLPVKAKVRSDIEKRGDPVIRYLTQKRDTDAFTLAGDLPRLFRKRLGDFHGQPYLVPLPEYVEKWKKYKGRVGIAWRSRTGSLKPRDLRVDSPVCLQYDVWDGHFETEGMEVPGINLRNDVEDILGICANLEKVVCCPNTLVHFAGAIGTKVEVILPKVGSGRVEDQYRWRYTSPFPWYSDVTVFENLDAYR
jgi:hypothetical protein